MEDNQLLTKLNSNLDSLIKSIEKQNNPKRTFLMAVLQGVGSVIGATIVAGVLLLVLSKFIYSIEQIPLIGTLVKSTRVESTIDAKINGNKN